MLALERRNLILEKLQEEKRVVVSELSQIYNVSEETIRRDLDKLHKDGLAVKSYGGAIINEDTNIDMPFNIRKKRNVEGKHKIGELVAKMVDNGDHIILDASTTAVFIAKALKHKENLTVLTNSIEIVVELSDVSGWNVVCLGGNLKEGYLALVGPRVTENLREYNVEKAFISCKGIDVKRGITDGNEEFSQAKQMMLHIAKKKIVAVDYTKFNRAAFAKICPVGGVDVIVTDEKPSEEWLDYLDGIGVECIYPGK